LNGARPIEILLVEDNPGDVLLTREALDEGQVPNRLWVARDGEEAMALLRHQEPHAATPRPDVILLDLNLPCKDGREVLAEIKADPDLRRIPVLILTTSKAEQDIRHAYDHHANSYLVKPADLEQFLALMEAVEGFWLSRVTLPP
jgi:two-component system, chemotaxis family, response regulator Rcp1